MKSGGRHTKGRRGVARERASGGARDPDVVEVEALDAGNLEPVTFDLDPALVERIRARRRLRQITLRVGSEQIEEARRVAARTGLKYQAILRRWLAEGASIARTARLRRTSR